MNRHSASIRIVLSLLAVTFLFLVSCGGGGGGGTVLPTYSISGTVSGATQAGVTINLTGAATASTVTGADGTFTFTGRANGTYTVTPVRAGYAFNPVSRVVVVSGANITSANFAATAVPTYSLSGFVDGDIAAGVTIDLTGAATQSTTTGADGKFTFAGLANGTYTVAPVMAGYTFTPANANITIHDADVTTGADFQAIAKPMVTWKEFVLTTSASSAGSWRRRTLTFDASTGILFTASSCLDSSGSTICPIAGSLTWTSSSGVIAENGSSADSRVHMTMTSTNNFIAGTSSSASGSYPQLRIALKVVPGTVYDTINDLRNKSFVFHEMIVGSATKWRYGHGSTDGDRLVTLASQIEPSGATTPDNWGTLNVDAAGVVTISGISTFSGFLANDKKTIVGTYTSGTTYRQMILQIITRNDYPPGPLPESTWKSSILAKSASIPIIGVQAGWVYCTNTVDSSGNMFFGADWTSDNEQFQSRRPVISYAGSLTSTGEVTMAESNYHGQSSDDWNFLVGTMTLDVTVGGSTIPVYFLQVSTR
ncbi:MAG: carboxypeptidase regulatory-like domain-containing protein [Deltaproteobacteria bacterium]